MSYFNGKEETVDLVIVEVYTYNYTRSFQMRMSFACRAMTKYFRFLLYDVHMKNWITTTLITKLIFFFFNLSYYFIGNISIRLNFSLL